MKTQYMKTQQSGFTLIELILVIVILGVLAATVAPKFANLATDARVAALKGVEAAMRSTNLEVYAKAAVGNQLGATGSVSVAGVTVATVYGFAASASFLTAAMDLDSNYTSTPVTATVVTDAGAVAPATCIVTYGPAASQTAPPSYARTITGC